MDGIRGPTCPVSHTVHRWGPRRSSLLLCRTGSGAWGDHPYLRFVRMAVSQIHQEFVLTLTVHTAHAPRGALCRGEAAPGRGAQRGRPRPQSSLPHLREFSLSPAP